MMLLCLGCAWISEDPAVPGEADADTDVDTDTGPDIDPRLIVWLPFDHEPIEDESAHAWTTVVDGVEVLTKDGPHNDAYGLFSGLGTVALEVGSGMVPSTDALTFASWIRRDTDAAAPLVVAYKAGARLTTLDQPEFALTADGSKKNQTTYLIELNGAGYTTATPYRCEGGPSRDEWAHVVIVVDPPKDELLCYVNGSARLTEDGVSALRWAGSDSALTFGSDAHDDESLFLPLYGGLADLRIYDGALSADEIRDLDEQ